MLSIANTQEGQYTNGMSEALGTYLKSLREGQGLEAKDVLAQLGERLGRKIDPSRLWRAESGKAWPDGDFLTVLADILHARLEDFAWIQRNPAATAEDGRALAKRILTQEDRDYVAALANTDTKRAALLRRIAAMSDDPELIGRIQGYLDGLERSDRR